MPFKAIDLNLNIFCVHMIHICMKSAVRKKSCNFIQTDEDFIIVL